MRPIATLAASIPCTKVEDGPLCDNDVRVLLMRRIAWLLIACYALMLVRPAVPAFMDMLAHTFWQQQHMIVHEEHGQFHIHYEVQKLSHENGKGKTVNNNKYEHEAAVSTAPAVTTGVASGCYHERNYLIYTCHYPASYMDKDYIPPRA